jgi:hypothetical protein
MESMVGAAKKTVAAAASALVAAVFCWAPVIADPGDARERRGGGMEPPSRPGERRAMLDVFGRSYESWAAELRACTAGDMARAKERLPRDVLRDGGRKIVVSIKGRLLPGTPDINPIGCDGSPCCNGGPFDWLLVLTQDCPTSRRLKVWPRGAPRPLSGGGMDCVVQGFGADADRVIVTGTLGGDGDMVAEAELCRVPAELMLASQQLAHADYARLAAPPPGRRGPGTGAQPCPPPAPRRPPNVRAPRR